VHVLIKALGILEQYLGDVKATIAGPVELDYFKSLKSLVEKLNLQNNVTFLGRVKEEEKYALMRSHKVFALPSLKDYTPSVLLEVQALGLPVVATNVGAISEIVKHGVSGILVEPGNEHELAEALKVVLSNEELRQNYSKNAKEHAKKFTLEKAVDELEKIYQELWQAKF